MKRRGQVTIFIILAIVLIVLVISYFIFKDQINKSFVDKDFAEIQTFVQSCADSSGEQAIVNSAKKGGFYDPAFISEEGVSYYKFNDKWNNPSKEELENNLALEFRDLFLVCLDNFSNLTEYKISKGEIQTFSALGRDFVKFEVNYPLSISFGEKSANFESFSSKTKINYLNLYSATAEYSEVSKNSNGICLTCLSEVLEKYNLKAEVFDSLDKSASIYVFSDEGIKINGENLKFIFANEN
jgi:hypothetical protein